MTAAPAEQVTKTPFMTAEMGGGMQDTYHRRLIMTPDDIVSMMPVMLAAPFPNADATQEFRVISNNFDARYGFSPGAVVSIQTRSGDNKFHGAAFDFIRNNDLNASDYFSHKVDSLKRNQFGGEVGGPTLRNKAYFFFN